MKISAILCNSLFGGLMLFSATTYADSTIVIVRHGEKPASGLGQLTCKGLNRSLSLAPVLLSRFGTPRALYAPNPSKRKKDNGVAYDYIRPLATIEPLAIRVAMPVDLEFEMTEVDPLIEKIAASGSGTYFVAWEHHWAETLARHLLTRYGADPLAVPKWKDDDYDSILVIRIKTPQDGTLHANFDLQHENLDGVSDVCP